MALEQRPACPVHAEFDPLAEEFLADPYAVMAQLPLHETPVFYAPALDYYVVTRYADIEVIFLDPKTFSAGAAQLPLVALEPEATEILLAGGHKPQPSMVSLDPPAHTRLRRPASRAFTPRRVAEMEPRVRATLAELLDAVDPSQPFDLVQALTFPLRATIIFRFMGVRRRTTASSRSGAATARRSRSAARPPPSRSSTRRAWPPTAATYATSSPARRTTARTTPPARCLRSTTRTPRR
ncbi:MAG TPA: hypothetical protein VHF51_00815 [Solirubrobacteraceae bacterium]|nr:hypothetical protein [Solirubrobacteraceae bacterium]